MTAAAPIWTRLDLERTSDVAAIRRAYAKRLKQTDVEADPAAFIALREALEAALAYARARAPAGPPAEPFGPAEPSAAPPPNDLTAPVLAATAADGLLIVPPIEPKAPDFRIAADAAPARAEEAPAPPADPRPAAGFSPIHLVSPDGPGGVVAFAGEAPVDEPTRREQRLQRLHDLLFADPPEAADEIGPLAAAILADPEMTNLRYAAWVEGWMAEMICAASPRSDPVIAAAVPHFRWDEDFGRLDQPPQVAAIMEHWRGLHFLHHISQPGHSYYSAWRDLVRTQDDESLDLNRWFIAHKVRSLLAVIREKYPSAESGLDGYRVALWEERLYGPPQWLNIWGVAALLFFPPVAVLLVFVTRNPTWFRMLIALWATLWVIGSMN